MTSSTKPIVTLTIDMQHAVFQTLRQQNRGFQDLADTLGMPHLSAKKLVRLCQETDAQMLRQDWETVSTVLQHFERMPRGLARPNEDALVFPYRSYSSHDVPSDFALKMRACRERKKQMITPA